MPRHTVGLDIGTSGVRAVEVASSRRGVRVLRRGELALPVGAVQGGDVVDVERVAGVVRELWSRTGFRSRRVVVGIASPRVLVRPVDLPPMPRAEQALALPFQVQDILPVPVDQATMDFVPLEERTTAGVTTVHGLVVAAPTDVVLARVRSAQAAGLRVHGVDLTSFAVLRALRPREAAARRLGGDDAGLLLDRLRPGADRTGGDDRADADDGPGAEAVVDIGAHVTEVVAHVGGSPRFVRIMAGGCADLTTELSTQMGISPQHALEVVRTRGVVTTPGGTSPGDDVADVLGRIADRLAEGVRGSLEYYASSARERLTGVLLTGGAGSVPGLPQLLGDVTGLPVRVAGRQHEDGSAPRPLPGRGTVDTPARYAAALGLALPRLQGAA